MDVDLDPGTVRIRWVSIGTLGTADLTRWRATLHPEERARAERFRFAADQSAFIAARGLARAMIANVTGMTPAALRFTLDRSGKPHLSAHLNYRGFRFNLSHSRTLVACGLALTDEIGIDIEELGHKSVVELADRFFAPAEAAIVSRATPAQREKIFLRLWTLKEAFVKATGEGLGRDLADFAFTLDPVSIEFRAASRSKSQDWQFAELCPSGRHVLALAIHRNVGHPIVLDAKAVQPDEF